MSDDQPKDQKEIEEQASRPDPDEPAKKPANDVPPDLFTVPSVSEKGPWSSGGGCGRLPAYGCAFAVVVLVAALIVGVTLMRRSVWMTFERARQQVVQGLPYDIEPGERLRTTRNLERFRTVLESSSDPYPLMGEFVKRVRGAFDDGQLSAEEVEEINEFVEKAIEDSGMPGMQLEGRNSEFGTRRRQRSWFKAHPEEEPMNHPLVAVRHGARRAPVTRRRRRSWFKARPKEEPMNHPLVAVRHGARRAPVIRNFRHEEEPESSEACLAALGRAQRRFLAPDSPRRVTCTGPRSCEAACLASSRGARSETTASKSAGLSMSAAMARHSEFRIPNSELV